MTALLGLSLFLTACDKALTLPVPPEDPAHKSFVLEAFDKDQSTGLFALETGPVRAELAGNSRFELFALPYSLQGLGVAEGALSRGTRVLQSDRVFAYLEGAWSPAADRGLELEALPVQRCIDQGLCLGSLLGQSPAQLSCVPCTTDFTVTPPERPSADCPLDWQTEVVVGVAVCSPVTPIARDLCSAGRMWQGNLGCAEVSPCGASQFPAPRPGRSAIYVSAGAMPPANGTMAAPYAQLDDVPLPLPANTDVLLSAGEYRIDVDLSAMTVWGNGQCSVLTTNAQRALTEWTGPALHDLSLVVASELQLSATSSLSQVDLRGPGRLRVSGSLTVEASLVSLDGIPNFLVERASQLTVRDSDLLSYALINAEPGSTISLSHSRLLNTIEPSTSFFMISVMGGQADFDSVLFDGQDMKFAVGAISLQDSDATFVDVEAHNLDTFVELSNGTTHISRTVLTDSDAVFDGRFADFQITDLKLDGIAHALGDSLQTDITVQRAWIINTSSFDSPSPGDVVFEDTFFVKGEELSRYLISSEGPGNLTLRRVFVQLAEDGFLFGGFTSALDVMVEDLTVLGEGGSLGLSAEALTVSRAELAGFRQIRMEEAFLARQEPGSRWTDLRVEQSTNAPAGAAFICLGKDHALRLERFDISSRNGAVIGLDLNEGPGLSASVFKDGVFRLPPAQAPYDLAGACSGSPLAPDALLPEHSNVDLQAQ